MSESRWDQPPYTMDEFYREMDVAKVQQFKSILVSSNTPIETPIKERFKEILNIILRRKNVRKKSGQNGYNEQGFSQKDGVHTSSNQQKS